MAGRLDRRVRKLALAPIDDLACGRERSGCLGRRSQQGRTFLRLALVELLGGVGKGGLGAGVVGELGEQVTIGLLGVGEAAGLELGLAESVLRSGGIGIESSGLAESGDGWVVLFFSNISETQAEIGMSIFWILRD